MRRVNPLISYEGVYTPPPDAQACALATPRRASAMLTPDDRRDLPCHAAGGNGRHAAPGRALRATVRRTELVATLADPDAPPFIVLVAPAGFGKTTLLCEWEARDPRPFAWVTVDRRHDEPNALLQAIAAALDVASAESEDGRVVLVLDDVHLLQSAAARETVAGDRLRAAAGAHGRARFAHRVVAADRAPALPGPGDRVAPARPRDDARRSGRPAARRRAAARTRRRRRRCFTGPRAGPSGWRWPCGHSASTTCRAPRWRASPGSTARSRSSSVTRCWEG